MGEQAGLRVSTFTGQKLNRKEDFHLRIEREHAKEQMVTAEWDPVTEWELDEEITKMTERYTEEFRRRFQMGFYNYVAGEWDVAKKLLEALESVLQPPTPEEDLLGGSVPGYTEQDALPKDLSSVILKALEPTLVNRTNKLLLNWRKKLLATRHQQLLVTMDGPSLALLAHMKQYDYVAPKDWPGYRRIEV